MTEQIQMAPRTSPSTLTPPPVVAPEQAKSLGWRIGHDHDAHKTSKDEAIEAVMKDEKIPLVWRNAISEQIKAVEAKAVEVHAHCLPEKSGFILHVHIKKLF